MFKKRSKILLAAFNVLTMVFITCQCGAQTAERIYHLYTGDTKVTGANGELSMAWCGGVNNPQFAMADLNKDGRQDLIIFEQVFEGSTRTFINVGGPGQTNYRYDQYYEKSFGEAKSFIKLMDYNNDGVPDMWTAPQGGGCSICKGYYNQNNELSFMPCKEIRYKYGSVMTNLNIPTASMPDMKDVDGDGDIDVLSYSSGGSLITWYKNFQKEDGLSNDSMRFYPVSGCWGRFIQIESARTRELHYYCVDESMKPAPQNKTTDGSHGVTLLDYDGDGDYDILDGSNGRTDIQLLINGKAESSTTTDSMISQDTLWQTGGKVLFMRNFPVAYWMDIDNDGDKDILLSPFASGASTENYRCVAYYKNIGSNNAPNFNYQTDTLFITDMIDYGSNAHPLFYDYDRDGKPDMLVGSGGIVQANGKMRSKLVLYKNTGVAGQKSFTLQNNNLLDLYALNITGSAPAVGDLDGDGKDDLVIGMTDGTLLFYQNVAVSNNDVPDWQPTAGRLRAGSTDIDAGDYATPLLYDFDKDGDMDLIIGNMEGKLVYYENTGNSNPGKPSLQWITNSLGNVSVAYYYRTSGFSAPYIGRIDNTNTEYLLVGNDLGSVSRFSFQPGNTTANFVRLDSIYSEVRVKQQYASPTIADIDGDGKFEMAVGTGLGGVVLYKQLFNVDVQETYLARHSLKLYPNPAKDEVTISIEGMALPTDAAVRFYNSMGQQLLQGVAITKSSDKTLHANISELPAGVYLCSVILSGKTYTSTFIKQ